MVKRYLEDENAKRFETVRECLETAIKEEGLTKCYYHFTADGNCSIDLFESTRAHAVEPKEMVRLAEKFFNEFDWVHFEGIGKNGKACISCYLADETKESFFEKRMQRDKERKQKILTELKEKGSKEAFKEALKKWKTTEEWKEK